MINLIHGDCMDYMTTLENNEFDLAVVDPPYFKDFSKSNYTGAEYSTTGIKRNHQRSAHWEIPNQKYFEELLRVSKHQIIWGINYYSKYVSSVGRIIWDKQNDYSTFSKCEIASQSFGVRVDQFRFRWNGMLQGDMKNKQKRIHPCQKPIQLYQWIFDTYAQKGWKILDTHLGSGSSAIAAHDSGLNFVGIELDTKYFQAARERLKEHQKQLRLFI